MGERGEMTILGLGESNRVKSEEKKKVEGQRPIERLD